MFSPPLLPMGKLLQIVCLSCCLCVVVPARANEGVQVGVASGLELADFDDATGALTWQLKARQAMPEVGRVARVDDNAVWVLRDVAIRSFSKGKQFLTISTPECRYARGEKQASGPSQVTLEGALFLVSGEHWNWQRGVAGEETVQIFRNVRVTLRPEGKLASPITIFSKEAKATLRRDETGEGRTELVFTDGSPDRVRVMMKDDKGNDIVLRSNRLTVRIKAGRTQIGSLAAADAKVGEKEKMAADKGELEALDEIVAEENVWLHSQSRAMFGETATYRHGERLFTVTGQPRVEDVKQELTVRGGKLAYFLAKETVLMESLPSSVIPSERSVFLTVPSFTAKEKGGLAQLTGERLEIELREKTNVIKMTGAVRGVDVDFNLESDYLEVETPHEAGLFEGGSVMERSTVNRIVARRQVRAVYEGRELRCEEATILPKTETVLLRGRPTVAVPKSGARLSGHAIDLKKAERTITVTAEPGDAPARERVVVVLPPLKTMAAAGASSAWRDTTVASDRLVMTEDVTGQTATFDFTDDVVLRGTDLEGRCDQLEILADRQRAASGGRGEMAGAAQIQRVLARGNVVLGTSRFVAEGEQAEIFPKVALEEKSPHEQNGLDGREPQFITLRGEPGKRPRLTLLNPGSLTGEAKENTRIDRLAVTSDFMEIVNGREQDRFFLRGNVRLEGKDINGSCELVEGRIVSEAAARGKKNWTVSQIQGRGGVVFYVEDNKASGEAFEMLPETRKVYLTGSPRVRSGDGVEAIPGRRIVYDWESKNWNLEGQRGTDGQSVTRPEIRIPLKRRNP